MDPLAQFTSALPTIVVGFVLAFYLRGRFQDVDRRFDEQKAEMNRRFDEQRADTDRRFEDVDRRFEEVHRQLDRLSAEIAGVRSDLTNVALAVGARLRPEAGTG